MPGMVALPQPLVALDLQLLFAETKETCHCGDTVRIRGHLIISGQLSHTPGFSPPAKQENQLQDLQRHFQIPLPSPAQKHFFLNQSSYITLGFQVIEWGGWGTETR